MLFVCMVPERDLTHNPWISKWTCYLLRYGALHIKSHFTKTVLLTLYSIVTPFDTFEISHNLFENIMENGAFALLEQMLNFP